MLTLLRGKWWIPGARQVIKNCLDNCVKCLKVKSKHFPLPAFSNFPPARVTEARPFQVTGIDYTGALFVRDFHLVDYTLK